MILMMIFIYVLYISFTFTITNMSIKYYVLVVLGISPQGFLEDLHGNILYSCVCLCNCLYVVTEIKFNSIKKVMSPC